MFDVDYITKKKVIHKHPSLSTSVKRNRSPSQIPQSLVHDLLV